MRNCMMSGLRTAALAVLRKDCKVGGPEEGLPEIMRIASDRFLTMSYRESHHHHLNVSSLPSLDLQKTQASQRNRFFSGQNVCDSFVQLRWRCVACWFVFAVFGLVVLCSFVCYLFSLLYSQGAT